ncbi:hypothetical protein C4K40_2505 [Pseudomonas sp. CMR5c]|nr:hypothetical protein C4K40_2505 [Pseudomonas sp. CMR5c]
MLPRINGPVSAGCKFAIRSLHHPIPKHHSRYRQYSAPCCEGPCLTDLALKAYEQALQPKRLELLEGGHFDPYLSGFDQSSQYAIEWFAKHL